MIGRDTAAPWRRGSALLLVGLLLAGCSGAGASEQPGPVGSGTATGETGAGAKPGGATADVVRLGFFANVTHAPALVGVGEDSSKKSWPAPPR